MDSGQDGDAMEKDDGDAMTSEDLPANLIAPHFVNSFPGHGQTYSYSMADTDAVLKLLLPLYKDILKNAAHSCSIPKRVLVINVAISAIID